MSDTCMLCKQPFTPGDHIRGLVAPDQLILGHHKCIDSRVDEMNAAMELGQRLFGKGLHERMEARRLQGDPEDAADIEFLNRVTGYTEPPPGCPTCERRRKAVRKELVAKLRIKGYDTTSKLFGGLMREYMQLKYPKEYPNE